MDQGGTLAHQGVGSFVISNDTTLGDANGTFGGWPFGPGLSAAAGQPSSGASADLFFATVWFRSVSSSADGSNLEIDLGSSAGDDRNNFLAVTNEADADGGLQLRVAESDGTTGDTTMPVVPASALTRGTWHKLDIRANFIDGSNNDTFTLTLDGTTLLNSRTGGNGFTTFEGYFEGNGQPYVQSNRLYFRSGGEPSVYGAFPDTGAAGFALDDISYRTASSSAPTTPLAYYYTGFEARASLTQVSTSFAGLTAGSTISDADPGTPGNQGAVFGTDAFATLTDAAAGTADGGRIQIQGGTYAGDATLGRGITLAPGNGAVGTAFVRTGGVTFDGTNTLAMDLNGPTAGGGYDQLSSTGRIDLGGATLALSGSYTPVPGDSITLVSASGGLSGTFAGLPDGSVFKFGSSNFRIRYSPTAATIALDTSNVSVTVTDGQSTVTAGGGVTYTITVTNAGPYTVEGGVRMNVALPAGLVSVTYTSTATGGAGNNTTFGYGAPADSLFVPPGGVVTYTLTGTVLRSAAGPFTLTATAAVPTETNFDPDLTDNTAADTDAVFTPDTTPAVTSAGPLTAGRPTAVTVQFSEVVGGFDASDVRVTNGTVSGFGGAGSTYTFTLTPTAAGSVQVVIGDGAAFDAAGNPSVAATAAFVAQPLAAGVAQPRVAVGVDGNLLRVFTPPTNSFRDFSPFPGFTGPITTAQADLNGDGVPDVVVGAGAGGGPHVKVFDGATGTETASFYAYDAGFTGGVTVAVGDVNNDGVADIVTGAGAGGGPNVKVFDGKSMAATVSFFAFDAGFGGGVNVAATDGKIVVGAGAGGGPNVRVFDGTGAEQAELFAYDQGFRGGVRVAVEDANGDGTPDIVTGAGPGGGPHVKGFNFADLTQVQSIFATLLTGRPRGVRRLTPKRATPGTAAGRRPRRLLGQQVHELLQVRHPAHLAGQVFHPQHHLHRVGAAHGAGGRGHPLPLLLPPRLPQLAPHIVHHRRGHLHPLLGEAGDHPGRVRLRVRRQVVADGLRLVHLLAVRGRTLRHVRLRSKVYGVRL